MFFQLSVHEHKVAEVQTLTVIWLCKLESSVGGEIDPECSRICVGRCKTEQRKMTSQVIWETHIWSTVAEPRPFFSDCHPVFPVLGSHSILESHAFFI
jgi:hypothetical protein